MQPEWFLHEPVRYITRISRSLWSDPESLPVTIDAAVAMGADTVMPFTTMTLDPQHPTPDAVRERAAELAAAFLPAKEKGLQVEVNFYSTQGHGPRTTACQFDWVVAGDGEEIVTIPCPLGPRFRRYIVEAYGSYLDAVGTAVWIDDDLRLDNHGGVLFECFCPIHLERFAELTGTSWTVDDVVDLLKRAPELCDADDIHHRAEWRSMQAEGLAELCRLLAERAADAGGEIARMTPGGFAGHIRTGVDLNAELEALQEATPVPSIRLGGAVYSDDVPRDNLVGQLAMDADAATLTTPCRPFTEIDTFPSFPGQKSAEMLTLELTTATASWGADHTLALLPSLRRLVPDLALYDRLARHRHHLGALRSAIADLIADGGVRLGMSQLVGVDPEVTARRDLTTPAALPWNTAMAQLGVPVNPHDPQVIIVDAATVLSWAAKRVAEMVRTQPALITAEALHLLQEKGHLREIGVSVTIDPSPPTYEVEEITIPGVLSQRAMSWFFAPADGRHVIEPGARAEVWSSQIASDGRRAPGLVLASPTWGGASIAVTTHRPGELRDPGRQRLFHEVFDKLSGTRTTAVDSALNIYPVHWSTAHSEIVVLANYGHTTHTSLALRLPTEPDQVQLLEGIDWTDLPPSGSTLSVEVGCLASAVLRFRWAR